MTDNAQEREDIETLLPWFAAGTLDRKDAARVEKALASDAELSRRFDMVREELGETIRLNESLGAPSARAMKTLFEKIDAESPAARSTTSSVSLTTRISEFIMSLSPRTLAYAGTAAALAIVLQAGVITGVLMNERGGGANYRSVAIEQGAPAGAVQGSFALIRFAPEASAADITKLLEDQKASIVSGPSAGGIYRVQIAMTGLPKDDLARLVKQLQDNKAVSFVAPAQ
jgi:hypothetical protein